MKRAWGVRPRASDCIVQNRMSFMDFLLANQIKHFIYVGVTLRDFSPEGSRADRTVSAAAYPIHARCFASSA
jgi:hypothetical protein